MEHKYSFDARMTDDSNAILTEIADLISIPDADKIAAEMEEILIIDDEED